MKKFLLGSNIVLIICVAVLFYLNFKKPGSSPVKSASAGSGVAVANGAFNIAYFEMDSIENNYEYLKVVRNELKSKESEMSGQLNNLKKRYYEKVNKFQQEAAGMTQEKQGAMQEELMGEQKMIQNKEQALGLELQDASFNKMQEVNKTIENYLKEFNKDKGYSYILAHQPGTIYFKDPNLDITSPVLEGLNENYKKKK